MDAKVGRFAKWGLAAAAFGLLAATQVMPSVAVSVAQASGLVDTDPMDDTFVQLNDVQLLGALGGKPDEDTFTIRGRVQCETGEDPVADGVANGVTVTAFESGEPRPPIPFQYTPVKSKTFTPSQCKAIFQGRSLYCKDTNDGSFFRLRRSSSPTKFRVNTVVRQQEFVDPAKPFGVPLAGDVLFTGFHWFGETDANFCRVTHNGERTTCRVKN
ncbi:MAG: hypothetical protein ACKO2K_03355 [Alphaproteobacteria bacterium]